MEFWQPVSQDLSKNIPFVGATELFGTEIKQKQAYLCETIELNFKDRCLVRI